MKLGTMVSLKHNDDIDAKIANVSQLGFEYCQMSSWDMEAYTDEMAEKILAALEKYNVKISTFWCGWTGKCVRSGRRLSTARTNACRTGSPTKTKR